MNFFADDVNPSQNTSGEFIMRPLPKMILHRYKRLYATRISPRFLEDIMWGEIGKKSTSSITVIL